MKHLGGVRWRELSRICSNARMLPHWIYAVYTVAKIKEKAGRIKVVVIQALDRPNGWRLKKWANSKHRKAVKGIEREEIVKGDERDIQ